MDNAFVANLSIRRKIISMKKPVTLRDFLIADNPKLKGKEPDYYARFRAGLRIAGEGLDFEEISRTLGLKATHTHRKGGKRKVDMWLYYAPVDRTRPLDEHIMAIWEAVRPQMTYLRQLKKRFKVDLCCGYQSNSCTGGFNVDHRCLGLFAELDIPFGVSVIIV
jgi:hypothetical protein